jgi:hypothetical protein
VAPRGSDSLAQVTKALRDLVWELHLGLVARLRTIHSATPSPSRRCGRSFANVAPGTIARFRPPSLWPSLLLTRHTEATRAVAERESSKIGIAFRPRHDYQA